MVDFWLLFRQLLSRCWHWYLVNKEDVMKIHCQCDFHRQERQAERRKRHASRPKHGRKARVGEKDYLDEINLDTLSPMIKLP